MDNPQKSQAEKPAKTEMVSLPRKVNMIAPSLAKNEPANVHIRALDTIRVTDDLQLAPGEEAYVTETQAKEFCRVIEGQYAFGGQRQDDDAARHKTVRAERVNAVKA